MLSLETDANREDPAMTMPHYEDVSDDASREALENERLMAEDFAEEPGLEEALCALRDAHRELGEVADELRDRLEIAEAELAALRAGVVL